MKKIVKKIKEKLLSLKNAVSGVIVAEKHVLISAKEKLASNAAEGYIDTGVKIIIGVVIGGVILAGLYTLFNTSIIPTLTSKIGEMFNYGS